MKNLRIKLKTIFNLKWFFQIKQGLNLKRKEVQGLLCFFPMGNAKTKLNEREMTGIKENWTSIKRNIIFMHALPKGNEVADTCCTNISNLSFFLYVKRQHQPRDKTNIAKKSSWNDELTPEKMLWKFSF